jgi:hypothetical protein
MVGIETRSMLKSLQGKGEHLYEDDPEIVDDEDTEAK